MVVSPNQAPDPKDVEDALRALNVSRIREGRAHVATDETDRNDPLDFGRDFAPSIVPPDENAQIGTEELASKASLGKRLAGATIGSIIIAPGVDSQQPADQKQRTSASAWARRRSSTAALACSVERNSPPRLPRT